MCLHVYRLIYGRRRSARLKTTKSFSSDLRILMIYEEECMRLTHILILLALLMPLALSAPASDTPSGGAATGIQGPSAQHAPNVVTNASEHVFVGSIKSDKYHYPSCRAAQKIKPENEIWFKSSADARAHGYVPCGICNPP